MARLIAGQELPGIETPRRPSGIVGREQYVRDMNHLEMARAWHVQTNDGALSAREGDSGESTEGFFFSRQVLRC